MEKGKIKWFNNELGYGFITSLDEKEIFFHYSRLKQLGYRTITSGQYVTYRLVLTKRGYRAYDVCEIKIENVL